MSQPLDVYQVTEEYKMIEVHINGAPISEQPFFDPEKAVAEKVK